MPAAMPGGAAFSMRSISSSLNAMSAARTFSSNRFDTARTRDRHHVIVSSQQPRESELRGRAALGFGELADAIDDREVPLEVLALKARVVASPVVGGEIVNRLEAAREKAAPERGCTRRARCQAPRA